MKLQNRTILITGGSSGIGLELAKVLLARGNRVLITGRDQQKLHHASAALPGVVTLQSDASKSEDIETLRQRVIGEYPECDVLINNAGTMRNLNVNNPVPLTDLTHELDLNLSGPIRMVQAFLPHLKAKKNSLIVNVSSGLAYVPFPLAPIYSASKAGLHAYTRCLRVQLQGSSVSVVELAPPLVDTELARQFDAQLKGQKGMRADVHARKAVVGIEAGKKEVRPGQSTLLYILSRLAPSIPFNAMAKLVKTG